MSKDLLSKELLPKQSAYLRGCLWLKILAGVSAVLATTQASVAQTVVDSNRAPSSESATALPSPPPEQTAATTDGFAGGISSNDFVPLMDLIQSVIAPDSWQDNGGEGAILDYPAGVYVDAASIVASVSNDIQAHLNRRLRSTAHSAVTDTSELRIVSLNRIEQAIAEATATGGSLSDELQNLAGIYRVDCVVIDRENADVLIAGPAGRWRTNTSGRVVNVESGLPVLQLDDLIVCLINAFSAEGKFGCTILPKPAALKSAQEFIAKTKSRATGRKWRESLRAAVGKQEVIVHGVAPDSGVAQTIVAADYLMKKIGMGLAPTIDQCPSYFDRVGVDPAANKDQTLIRWWFTMAPPTLTKDADDRIFQFSGNSIKVLSENELLDQQGRRVHTGDSDDPTAGFAEDFSRNIALLSEKYPVFASLKNVFDLALAANIVKKYDVLNRLRWQRRFGATAVGSAENPEGRTRYVLVSHAYDAEVDSIMNFETFNFRIGGKRFRRTMVGVSGGVEFDSRRLFKTLKITEASPSRLPQVSRRDALANRADKLPVRWWWD